MTRTDPATSRIELLQGTLDFKRLMRQRVIAAEWGVSDTNRRVRMYRLTPKGRERLAAERSKWERLTVAIAGLMTPPTAAET